MKNPGQKIATILILAMIISIATNTDDTKALELGLTIGTDRTVYTYRDLVTIGGNLTFDNASTNGLIAMQVNDPNDRPIVARTTTIGNPDNLVIQILSAVPGDENGLPQENFNKSEHVHLNVTIQNLNADSRNVLISVIAYDSDSTPILPEANTLKTTILPGAMIQFKPDLYIDSWVSTGSATFFVNVYSDWPKNGGYAYCSEKNATFNIEDPSETPEISNTKNSFEATFRLPPRTPFGNYTITATASSSGMMTNATATFTHPFQLVGDVNFDHTVNILDIVSLAQGYGTKSGSLGWRPTLDIDPNAAVDLLDILAATTVYGTTYVSTTTLSHESKMMQSPDSKGSLTGIKAQNRLETGTEEVITGLDIYTQYPAGYNGKGLDQASDMFWTQKEVQVNAYAVYYSWPEQNKDISFEVRDPYGETIGIFYNRTNQNGTTYIRFRLPTDIEYYQGEWIVTATTDIAGSAYKDTLRFKYDYRARLWSTETSTNKPSYAHEEMIEVTISYGTQSMQTFPVLFTITALDETEVQFSYEWAQNTIGGAQYGTYANGTLTINLYIPKFARSGIATVHVNILQNISNPEVLCPEVTLTVQIEP